MTGLQFASLFCVLLIKTVAGQFGQLQCQPDISLSLDDLLRAMGQGNSNQQTIVVQDSCNLPSIPISIQQPCGCQPSISISNSCGCGPSLSIASQPISISNQRSCGCGIQQPSFTIGNQNACGCGQTFQQSPCGCGQQSFTINNQNACGCGQPSFIAQPVSISNQICGCQQSIGISQPISVNQQCGSQQLQSALSLLSQQCGGNQLNNQAGNVQISCNPSNDLVIQNQCFDVENFGNRVIIGNAGGNVANVVPAALLQAPPFGIYFAGDNLIIDGAVQVCGSMPFSSAVQISGRVPACGSGCVQYACNDFCS